MRWLIAIIFLSICSPPVFALSPPPSYADAQRAFDQLPLGDRLSFKIALTAAGYWPATADPDFNRKLFEATTQFQADNGLSPTGAVDKELLAKVYRSASPLLAMWGFRQIAHPYRGRPIWAPMGLGLIAERDQNGLTWRDPLKRVWMTYDYLRDANLAAAYNSVVAKVVADGGQITFKILKDDFFIVSSSTHGLDSYIRCQAEHPGVLWLSLFWLHGATDLHMDRAATLISGSFASAMSGAPFADIPQVAPPASPDATGAPPPPNIAPAAPAAEQKEKNETSGMGFLVNAGGDVVTNAHVVENCASITVAKGQIATAGASLVARDGANDLAVLKTTLRPEKIAGIRSGVSLGEAVAAHGFSSATSTPHAADLADGNVMALVGMGGDTRYMQISTPVGPADSGAPLFDLSGNVVGLVSAKRRAPNIKLATAGDIPQDVNFATKGGLVASFLVSNRIAFTEAAASHEIPEPDLAEQARAVSVSISCK